MKERQRSREKEIVNKSKKYINSSGRQDNNRKIIDNNEDNLKDKRTSEDAPSSPIIKRNKRLNTKSSTSNFGDMKVETRKRGKAVDWQTFNKFDSFETSELGKELKSDFVKHKVNKDGTGVYFCRYGKKKDFNCEVKYKIVKNVDGSCEMKNLEEIKHNHDKMGNTRIHQQLIE